MNDDHVKNLSCLSCGHKGLELTAKDLKIENIGLLEDVSVWSCPICHTDICTTDQMNEILFKTKSKKTRMN